jgi:hypothetical protein
MPTVTMQLITARKEDGNATDICPSGGSIHWSARLPTYYIFVLRSISDKNPITMTHEDAGMRRNNTISSIYS